MVGGGRIHFARESAAHWTLSTRG